MDIFINIMNANQCLQRFCFAGDAKTGTTSSHQNSVLTLLKNFHTVFHKARPDIIIPIVNEEHFFLIIFLLT